MNLTTFGQAGHAFLKFRVHRKSVATIKKHAWLLQVLEPLHERPLAAIKPPEVLKVLRSFEALSKDETARRSAQFVAQVFRFAIGEGWTENNPARDLRGSLEGGKTVSHAGITDPIQFGRLMTMIDTPGYSHTTVYNALRLLARVALRPGELRKGLWTEVNFLTAEWKIPGNRMKMRREFAVPLSKQAIEILKDQQAFSGRGMYIFPGVRPGRPLSDSGMGMALKTAMMIDSKTHVPHGFRTSFSTIMNERGWDERVIEACLSHEKTDQVAKIYNRAKFWPERRALMAAWADAIEEMKLQHALDIT
jgi:integrase